MRGNVIAPFSLLSVVIVLLQSASAYAIMYGVVNNIEKRFYGRRLSTALDIRADYVSCVDIARTK